MLFLQKALNILVTYCVNIIRLQDCAYSTFKQVLTISDKNLSDEEIKALKNLIENNDLVIQKTNKRNTIVVLHKNNYISRLHWILDDTSKFKSPLVEEGEALNQIIRMEECIIDLLKSLKN